MFKKDKELLLQEARSVINREMINSISLRRQKHKNTDILLMDDHSISQELELVNSALQQNFQIFVARDTEEAIEKYVEHAPHLVFLNISLSNDQGQLALQKIMEIDNDAFIIILIDEEDIENVMPAIKLGARGFISKPFNTYKLLEYVQLYAYENQGTPINQH